MHRFFYSVLITLLLPFTLLKLLWRARAQPAYLHFWAERYGFYAPRLGKAREQKSIIWLHCVSVGETMAAAPLVEALLKKYPNHQILLTHTTPTGRATSERLFANRVLRAYLPFDIPFAVNQFLTHFNPALGLLMETELWFNLIATASRRHIPLLLANARLSEKSARGYAKLGGLTRLGLNQLSLIAAQTEVDAMRFNHLRNHPKALPISVMGNLKFDVTPPNTSLALGESFKKILQSTTGLRQRKFKWACVSVKKLRRSSLLSPLALVPLLAVLWAVLLVRFSAALLMEAKSLILRKQS
jgi:3-deoxy-D-manno-octulosonic-acid transferase